jgi:negative regulator of sigma-B (phosphoserine phosphatase)
METIRVLPVESGVATFVLPGQSESGDHQLVRCKNNSILIAAVDGIGHGEEAANAAKAAISILESGVEEPIISLVTRCHERLRSTRGIVLSLASVDKAHEELLLRGGVVGSRLPPLQATVLPIAWDDTLVFVTDGVRGEFIETLSARESPQRAAERILEHYGTGIDDALVLVARFSKPRP